jgi:predicted  nucleic acid-binding Zn-ribbon protein
MSNETVVVEQFTKPKSNATKADLVKYIDHLVLENDKYVEKLAKINKRLVDKDTFIETLKSKINAIEKLNEESNLSNKSQIEDLKQQIKKSGSLTQLQANALKQELEESRTHLRNRLSEIDRLQKVPTWIRKIFGA